MRSMRLLSLAILLASAPLLSALASAQADRRTVPGDPGVDRAPITPLAGLEYDEDFFEGVEHDPSVPTPASILGYRLGERAANYAEVERCLDAWEGASPRIRVVPYATSYEGRTLSYVVIASEENMDRLEQIREGLAALADPRDTSRTEADRLARTLPAVAWMAYSIHGDETSGVDAALGLIYHLAAGRSDEIERMLDELVVIVDPNMNPDGRERFLKQLQEARGAAPNVDAQSLLHTGRWPWGRTNHYLFDLNRDWVLGVHPETRGRIRAVNEWRPMLFVDCHEMGSLDTYLFSPSREPVNPNLPPARKRWWDVFAKDQAAAFDERGWVYYTGEWNEEWYPGYSSSWAGFKGAVGILYEQAGIAEDAVRRPEGALATYREAVHHQYVSSMANLRTLLEHHETLMREFAEERRLAVSDGTNFADRIFAIPPTKNRSRLARFTDLMLLQGFEAHEATRDFSAAGTDQLGGAFDEREFPAGTLLIRNRQPEGFLLAAMLGFDPHMPSDFLQSERRELLRTGSSRLYDVTAWNTTMLHDIEAFELEASSLPGAPEAYQGPDRRATGLVDPDANVGWVIEGIDDMSVPAAGQLMERGLRVRVAMEPFAFDGRDFPRGSVVVTRVDNRNFDGSIPEAIREVCVGRGLMARGVNSGLSPDVDVADLGGEHFPLLQRPRIALVGGWPMNAYSYGAIWHLIDHRMGLRASYVDASSLPSLDLRAYNVLILPEAWGSLLDESLSRRIERWVEEGGTLIAIGATAHRLARQEGPSGARRLRDALEDLHEYELQVLREFEATTATAESERIFTHGLPEEIRYPWTEGVGERETAEERTRRDAWLRTFSPQGAMLGARTDQKHWLTFGLRDRVSVLYAGSTALLTPGGVETPIRLGVLRDYEPPAEDAAGANANAGEGGSGRSAPADAGRPGMGDGGEQGKEPDGQVAPSPPTRGPSATWSATPEGRRVSLRMSGLLWPEAAARLANAAYLTRESHAAGQIILFADDPIFRGSTLGTARALMNAMVYGPGVGTRTAIEP